jgi:adenosylmethionine-8-amino-7-oxononanoate aminotransferase
VNVLQHFVTPQGAPAFPEVDRADGIYIWDKGGDRYLDGSSGAVSSNIGHNNARVKAAMLAQADRVSFAYGRVWESEPHRELAKRVTGLAGLGFTSMFAVSGGSEAVEQAIKIARLAAVARGAGSRWKVVSRMPSYHGGTLALMGITGDPEFGGPFDPMFLNHPKVPAPFTYRVPDGMSAEDYARACAQALEDCIIEQGPETVLAFIMEPVGGTASGALVAPAIYQTMVRQICNRHGVLLIFDEVMSGAGRTGEFLAAHHWPDCPPDIVILAKGVSGSYAPLGCVLTRDDILDAVRSTGGLIPGHTYAANPQAAAVSCAVLQETVERQLIPNAAAMGAILNRRLHDLMNEFEIIGDVRGLGLLQAVEIVADRKTKAIFPESSNAIAHIRKLCMRHGLMLLSRRLCGGIYGEWLMLAPPLIITEEQVEELITSFRASLADFMIATAKAA